MQTYFAEIRGFSWIFDEKNIEFSMIANLQRKVTGLKITAGHWTMSGQDDYLSGQNLGLAVILTGHVRDFQMIKKIVSFISGKFKQLNRKISQHFVVRK